MSQSTTRRRSRAKDLVLVRSHAPITLQVWPPGITPWLYDLRVFRYERELNGGSRPPLRRIVTHDSPASLPMVLCVSGMTWSEERIAEDGSEIPPHPELEVTDGWYRLRARVDEALARAARKGTIRIGRKIAVVGARVCPPLLMLNTN